MFTLIPYIPIANFQDELFLLIRDFVPENAFKAIEETVKDILTRQRGGLLSLGFFMALIFSTNGFASIMTAFDASLHSFRAPHLAGPAGDCRIAFGDHVGIADYYNCVDYLRAIIYKLFGF